MGMGLGNSVTPCLCVNSQRVLACAAVICLCVCVLSACVCAYVRVYAHAPEPCVLLLCPHTCGTGCV